MAVSIKIGDVELNDQSTYFVMGLDLGDPVVDEVWIDPPVPGADPYLVRSLPKRTQVELTLAVKGTTAADLQTKCDRVRRLVSKANTMTYQVASGAAVIRFKTYPSPVAPAFTRDRDLYLAANYFWVPEWTLKVWREPLDEFPVL